MSQSPFKKFIAPKKNSVKKEEIRQEKKEYRKQKNAYFDKLKEEKYQARMAAKNPPLKKADPCSNRKTCYHFKTGCRPKNNRCSYATQ